MRGAARPMMPCGHRFCAGAVRMVWGQHDLTMVAAGAMIGCPEATLMSRADRLGCGPRARRKNLRHVPAAKLIAAFRDEAVSLPVAAARVGIQARVLQRRAAALGLPPRKAGNKNPVSLPADFDAMWAGGVKVADIAALCGCTVGAVVKIAGRRGLPARRKMDVTLTSLAEYRAGQVVRDMAATAARERRAMIGQTARMQKNLGVAP